MVALVSQAEALAQLRLIEAALTADQLADVNFKAEQASAIIVDYLKRPFIEGPVVATPVRARAAPSATDDLPPPVEPPRSWDEPPEPSVPPIPPPAWTPATVPIQIKGIILVVLTSLYDGRTPDDPLLSPTVCAALERYRDPALA